MISFENSTAYVASLQGAPARVVSIPGHDIYLANLQPNSVTLYYLHIGNAKELIRT